MHYRTIIISDVHLGTPDSKYQEVLNFLKSNSCDHLILNWDIIDGRFLRYFQVRPKEQRPVIEYILNLWMENKTKITYMRGNHERFRKNLLPIKINNITFADEIIYESWNKKYLICHGQQFDAKIPCCWKIIATLSFLAGMATFRLNRRFNERRKKHGYRYYSIVGKIKRLAKRISLGWEKSFEHKIKTILDKKHCDGLICWHLHKPEDKYIGKYHYLNSWDRVESCTALVETEDHERKLIKTNH